MIDEDLIQNLITIVEDANQAIMAVYKKPMSFEIDLKQDDSPVTTADTSANKIIVDGLKAISRLPIISEESELPAPELRQAVDHYWLVDPLDGTRGFIAQTDDFTVNIALMQRNLPVLGVVGLPKTGEIFVGVNLPDEQRAFKQHEGQRFPIKNQLLKTRQAQSEPLRLWISRHHRQERLDLIGELIKTQLGMDIEPYGIGSSLKFCRLAEGAGDLYLRFGPTSEWDVAAGQAVLAAVGGNVYAIGENGDLNSFRYNKENILNGPFCAIADDSAYLDLQAVLKRLPHQFRR